MSKKPKIASKFEKWKGDRANWEQLWELCAQYTIPSLFLRDEVRLSGIDPEDCLIGDSVGADVLNNFTSQISKVIFPTQGAFFRMKAKKNSQAFNGMNKSQQQALFRRMEENAMQNLYLRGLNAQKTPILSQVLGLGDAVYYVPPEDDEDIEVYDLNDTVIKRSANGKLTDVITRDITELRFLDISAQEKLKAEHIEKKKDEKVTLYTHVSIIGKNKYEIKQYVDDVVVNDSENFYPRNKCPYQVVSLATKRGANYSMGIVMLYLALLHKANVYSDTASDTAVAGSLVNWAVSPSSQVRPEEFAQRDQGEAFVAKRDDITAIIADVGNHLQITNMSYKDIVATLHRVFLMFTAVQRDGERVTAEEIRRFLQKLEETHSGLYALLADGLQRPLALIGVSMINDPELIAYIDEVDVDVVTALEALSRGAELENTLAFLANTNILANVPPQVLERLNLPAILGQLATNGNVSVDDFVKSEEQFQQEQQALAEQEAEAQGQVQPALSQTQVFQANDAVLDKANQPLI